MFQFLSNFQNKIIQHWVHIGYYRPFGLSRNLLQHVIRVQQKQPLGLPDHTSHKLARNFHI